jgi:LacI family transcriptional regulator
MDSQFEDKSIARDVTDQLLRREPDLTGLYVAGGGIVGVLDALKAAGRWPGIVTVGHDLTEHTRMGLIDNNLSLVLAHPISRLANESVQQMLRDLRASNGVSNRVIGFEVWTPENI